MNKTILLLLAIISLSIADAVMCPVSKAYPDNLLRHTSSNITVILSGQIAETIVESEFKNEWNQQTSGVYSFPLPLDANVTGLWYDYKGQYYQAVLKEIPQVVNPGTGDGGFAAELNQYTGKNSVSFKIDSIQPGTAQHIIMRYIQKIQYNSGLFTYTYPLNSQKFQPQPVDFIDITVQIKNHTGIKSFFSSSHPDNWRKIDTTGEYITLKYSEDKSYLQQDFIFHYEAVYDSFVHETYAGLGTDKSGFFVTSIFPGTNLDSAEIYPKNIAFCIDASRSMSGSSLKAVCSSVKSCLALLDSSDRFSLISFNDLVVTHLNSVVPSKSSIANAQIVLDSISSIVGTNGSDLGSALNKALLTFNNTSLLNNVIVFTDGFSPVAPEQIINTKNAGIFPIGIGSDISREKLEAIANYHNGFATFAPAGQSINSTIEDLFSRINSPIIKQMKIVTEGSVVSDLLPESANYAFYHGLGLLLIGKYSVGKQTSIGLTGKSLTGDSSHVFSINFPSDTLNQTNMFVQQIWAAEKIRSLERQIDVYNKSSQLRPEAIQVSLKYGVKSRFTSYWADNTNVFTGDLPGEIKTSINHLIRNMKTDNFFRILFESGVLSLHFTVPNGYEFLGKTDIKIFDINGRIIARLFEGNSHSGVNSFRWDLKKLGIANGTYFIITQIGNNVFTNKINIIR